VTNFWLRSGDTSSSNNFLSFLENTLEKLENKEICEKQYQANDWKTARKNNEVMRLDFAVLFSCY
jgi:hypothetical protein